MCSLRGPAAARYCHVLCGRVLCSFGQKAVRIPHFTQETQNHPADCRRGRHLCQRTSKYPPQETRLKRKSFQRELVHQKIVLLHQDFCQSALSSLCNLKGNHCVQYRRLGSLLCSPLSLACSFFSTHFQANFIFWVQSNIGYRTVLTHSVRVRCAYQTIMGKFKTEFVRDKRQRSSEKQRRKTEQRTVKRS